VGLVVSNIILNRPMQLLSVFQIVICMIFYIFCSRVILELLLGNIFVYTSHRMIGWPCARLINGDNGLLRELQDPGVQKNNMSLGSNHTFVKVPVNPKK